MSGLLDGSHADVEIDVRDWAKNATPRRWLCANASLLSSR